MSQSFAPKGGVRGKREARPITRPYHGVRATHKSRTFQWGEVDPAAAYRFLTAVFDCGYMASFRLTSDGGACHVFLLHDAERTDYYTPDSESLTRYLIECHERWYSGVADWWRGDGR